MMATVLDWITAHSGHIMLVSFFAGFAGIVLWAYRPANRARLEQHRDIPFRETE
jgi:cbb3-type cytochrome oxidase subunit 3